ncbi:MAG: BlaI/MecI/CopY family transcriptional regulator [Candidatus Dojkabacteria bacterium]|nr:BlaI/MecI/CopY family transcriptional regulator [Candidatus Dojkabacteria bacterium]MDQ7020742.1 BlaI/MecI/CopY family transcriptional regulator [Candidatus Dojkabacteria bacterium]
MSSNLLGELEQKIMNILWDSEEALKPSEVKVKLGEGYAYTTVMTVLTRLNEKELLSRCKKGKAYYYSPIECKEKFATTKLKNLFGGIISSYNDLAITQFVDAIEEEDPASLQKLKDYLNKASD